MLPRNTTYGDKRYKNKEMNLTDDNNQLREPYGVGDIVFRGGFRFDVRMADKIRYRVLSITPALDWKGGLEIDVQILDTGNTERGKAACLYFPIRNEEPKMEDWKDKCPSCGSRAYVNGDKFVCIEGC